MRRAWIVLTVILLLAAFLRFTGVDRYPVGFTPDEASFGYDAYSLLKTGKDQWGQSWPLVLRSFGDFKSPLYTYLTIPSVAVFGLNEFAVRLPNALIGVLAVLTTYLLVCELFKQKFETGYGNLALFAALLLAVSPWHVSLSRGAFEANLTTFLMPLGIWAFLKGIQNSHWMIVAAFSFGLNLFSYHSAKFVTPILVIVLLWLWRKQLSALWRSKLALVIFSIFVLANFYTILLGAGTRSSDVAIFNPTGGWGAVADRRYEAVQGGLSDNFARIFSNKLVYVFDVFSKNYLPYLSSVFLFTQGAGEATYGMIPGVGVLYLFELPFILVAIWALLRKPSVSLWFLVIWILVSPIPASFTKGPGYAANRAAVMMPAIQILSAYGGIMLWQIVSSINYKVSNIKYILFLGFSAFSFFSFFSFLETYFYHGPRINAASMLYGRKEAMEYVKSVEDQYEKIYISRALSEPHIFVAFYTKQDPNIYQVQSKDWLRYERQGLLFVDQLGDYSLGKYNFKDLNYQQDQEFQPSLILGRERDFPQGIKFDKKITFPDTKTAILIVSKEESEKK